MVTSTNLQSKALVVDDEPDIRELLEISLGRMNLATQSAATVAEARSLLSRHHFDLCFTDMRLPDGTGLDLIHHIQQEYPRMPVAVITAYGNAQMAVESLKAGAFDFIAKPLQLPVLRKLVDAALKLRAIDSERSQDGLLGDAPAIQGLRQMIDRLARSQAPVHITGESGTGKELVARQIHGRGPRGPAPFVPVNCGAIPSDLMESEFFGHLKGSFTGALRDKAGLFQAAEGGTLFLDEVAELPLHMQAKLLRALQERAVRAVGAEAEVPVNVRVISATHQDLASRVTDGRFRQDLYYRLNVIEIRTPPLREHPQDIPAMTAAILERIATANGLLSVPRLDAEAMECLLSYNFPGNVRELENVLERAAALCNGTTISARDLQLRTTTAQVQPSGNNSSALEEQIEEIERQAIVDALDKTRWNKTRAAELLGMSFRQLRYRIKKLEIE